MADGRTLKAHLSLLPKGHKDRAELDNLQALPEYLSDYIKEYRRVSVHRRSGLAGGEPLLETLDIFDRKLRIDRDPEETEILLTLDLIERAETPKPKAEQRGNRR